MTIKSIGNVAFWYFSEWRVELTVSAHRGKADIAFVLVEAPK